MRSNVDSFHAGEIPSGYRLLNEGEEMRTNDLFWAHPGQWEPFGECEDVGHGWNPSYRPVARKAGLAEEVFKGMR